MPLLLHRCKHTSRRSFIGTQPPSIRSIGLPTESQWTVSSTNVQHLSNFAITSFRRINTFTAVIKRRIPFVPSVAPTLRIKTISLCVHIQNSVHSAPLLWTTLHASVPHRMPLLPSLTFCVSACNLGLTTNMMSLCPNLTDIPI